MLSEIVWVFLLKMAMTLHLLAAIESYRPGEIFGTWRKLAMTVAVVFGWFEELGA